MLSTGFVDNTKNQPKLTGSLGGIRRLKVFCSASFNALPVLKVGSLAAEIEWLGQFSDYGRPTRSPLKHNENMVADGVLDKSDSQQRTRKLTYKLGD